MADSVSKSANYCSGFDGSKIQQGILLLSEVSLGNSRELYSSSFVTDIPNNQHHSTKGVGTMYPDPDSTITIDGNVRVPLGKLKSSQNRKSLYYNEFIVYREDQVKLRYLIQVTFDRSR
jgi:poly [ADP-ribose] polymerase